jgi:hypothetical protein
LTNINNLRGKSRRNICGAKIAEIMEQHGYCYTVEQCEGRWKTLVRGVKKVADYNFKSGNDLKTHPYEDELQFYSERPNIKPAYLVSLLES